MTCREIVSKAIYDYQILYKIRQENAEKIDILMGYCDAIDSLLNIIEGESIEALVEPKTLSVIVKVWSDEIVVYKNNDIFYDLADRSIAVSFCNGDRDDLMYTEFVFPSVFD